MTPELVDLIAKFLADRDDEFSWNWLEAEDQDRYRREASKLLDAIWDDHVIVKLIKPVGVNGADNLQWLHDPYIEQEFNGDVVISDRIGLDSGELSDVGTALLSAAARVERSKLVAHG